jgi:two-component system, sensor histidine kinase PdtaS
LPRRKPLVETVPLLTDRPMLAFAIAAALCFGATLLRWELEPYFPPGYPYVTLFPAVILTSFFLGIYPGIFAALLCGTMAWYFLIEPAFSFELRYQSGVALGFYIGVVAVDILLVHWMQSANARLRQAREDIEQLADERGALADRNAVLFRELQHRVGNNLQMIAAVLSLQMRGLKEPDARRALADASSRLKVIGNIQRQLYRPGGEQVELGEFVRDVAEQTVETNARPGIAIEIDVQSGLLLPPETALPMALILSEAIVNSIEHGFEGRESGEIRVALERRADRIVLEVSDDGSGLPGDFDPAVATSLGLQISRILARQLEADYALDNAPPGTRMRIGLDARRFAQG